MTHERIFLWNRFTLREAILLGFFATFIVLTRAGLRLHLHLPGHVMFFTMFFMIMARGCVPKIGAATLTGLIASLAGLFLGMGKGGPIVFVKFLLPALVVEAAGMIHSDMAASWIACCLTGAVAAALRVAGSTILESLMGLEEEVVLKKALFQGGMNALFGALGALAVPFVIRRLRRGGMLTPPKR